MRGMRSESAWLILIVLLFGLLLPCAAANRLNAWLRLRENAVEVTASISQVTDLGSASRRNSRTHRYRLHITYEVDGVTYRDVYYGVDTASPKHAPEVGQPKKVRLDPDNPQEISPEGGMLLFLAPGALVGCMLAMAQLMWTAVERWKPEKNESVEADCHAIQAALDARAAGKRHRAWLAAGGMLLAPLLVALVLRTNVWLLLAMQTLCIAVVLPVTLVLLARSAREQRVAELVTAVMHITPDEPLAGTGGRECWLLADGRQLPVDERIPGMPLAPLLPGDASRLALNRRSAVLWVLPAHANATDENPASEA